MRPLSQLDVQAARALRGVLFDLDDTLLDYTGGVSELWAATCRDAAGPAGLDCEALVGAIREARQWFWGDPVRHRTERVQMLAAWGKIAGRALAGIGCSDRELATRIAAEFHARRSAADRLFADARPCLDALRARDHVLGLVTNGDRRMQRDKLARHGLADYFDAVAIEGEVGIGKPEAAIFRRALDELGIAPCDAGPDRPRTTSVPPGWRWPAPRRRDRPDRRRRDTWPPTAR